VALSEILSSKSGNFSAFFSGRQSEKSSLTMSLPLAHAKNGDKQY
jgi:hypothetical protein